MLARLRTTIFVVAFGCLNAGSSHAQSFFATHVTDPATGVDLGSTARIRAVNDPTGFVTFSSTGAEAIGPYLAAVAYSLPDLLLDHDQFDAVGVVGGPSAAGDRELTAGGFGYRLALGDAGATLYANADIGRFELGTKDLSPLQVIGTVANSSIGVRQTWRSGPLSNLTGSMEFITRSERIETAGVDIVDEELRLVRLALLHSTTRPDGFQNRLAFSLTKGLPSLGASPTVNPQSSAAGSTTDFLRAAFSVEASVPLHGRFLLNAGIIGQLSGDSLPLSQRCGYGTNSYSRGFDRSYVNGDRCLGGRLELAYDIQRPTPGASRIAKTQAFLGIDHGHLWDNANAFSPESRDRWSSLSVGVRSLQGRFLGEISLTHILDQPDGATPQDETRLWFQAALQF